MRYVLDRLALFPLLCFVVRRALCRPFSDKGSLAELGSFFLVIFLASWAGGVWLSPFGPRLWGGYWLPFLSAGLFVARLLAATAPRRIQGSTVELVNAKEEEKKRIKTIAVLSIFFWIMLAALIVAILGHYF
jgi:hypothetical protein